jgi:hypothetical protein
MARDQDRTQIERHNARAEKRAARKGRVLPPEEQAAIVRAVLLTMTEGETLAEAAAEEGVKPSTVRGWIAADPTLMQEYMAVKRLQAQAWAEEAIQVARESTNQSATKDRLLVDTLKWAASKASPTEFGDKQLVEHQGAQEITVRVVEDDVPVRNPKAVAGAMESVTLLTAQQTMALPAPVDADYVVESSN